MISVFRSKFFPTPPKATEVVTQEHVVTIRIGGTTRYIVAASIEEAYEVLRSEGYSVLALRESFTMGVDPVRSDQ